MRKISAFIFLLLATLSLTAQDISIVPQPVSIKQPKIAANFTISPATVIILEGSGLEKTANFLNSYLLKFYGFKLKVVKNSATNNAIRLNYERFDNPIEGAYQMTIDNKGVYIAGDNVNGVFYGVQTLIQLLPTSNPQSSLPGTKQQSSNKLSIPYVSIEDAPRFAYRGMHLDVARHYMPLDFIKKYIDYLALHKLNRFHWHLTDDQGWRIEIKKYPKLTQIGAWRNGTIIGRYPGTGNDNKKYGGFYTQEQIKEIVKYASDRYITVIPEIEMPGHASAAIAAYPELSCFPDEPTIKYFPKQCAWGGDSAGKQVQQTWGVFDDVFAPTDYTFQFLQDVLDETLALFPSTYIHIGGDECPKENWKRSAFCQQLIKEKGLKDEHGLQSYFIQRIEKYINSKGRKIIGWDEILEGGLAPNAAVMSWRGEEGGIDAAKQKHEVIMTPGNPVYFDHTQSENEDSVTIGGYNPIEKVYAYDPIPKQLNAEEAKYVLGGQANLWTEYIKYPSKAEYMIFPRMAALSEILWSAKEKRNWDDFEKRLMTQFKRYDLWNTSYSKAYFNLETSIRAVEDSRLNPNENGILYFFKSKTKDATIYFDLQYDDIKEKMAGQIFKSQSEEYINRSGNAIITLKTGETINEQKTLSVVKQRFNFSKTTGKKITLTNEPSKKYPGDGAFTLVNGVQNEKGLGKSKEFLGFAGTNCEATIDFGSDTITINEIIIHTLDAPGSWIYFPSAIDISKSADGINFSPLSTDVQMSRNSEKNRATIKLSSPVKSRFIKINIINLGNIPSGNPGAGTPAWLFVDEIEVN